MIKPKLLYEKKTLCCFLLLFVPFFLFAQLIFNEKSLLLRPEFNPGDKKTYLVTDEYKIESSPIFPFTAEHQYEVSFTITDTVNGYTIAYETKTLSTKNKSWPVESIKSQLSDGLRVDYKISREGDIIELKDPESIRSVLFSRLDSVINSQSFSSVNKTILLALRDTLRFTRGIELFLKPLALFASSLNKPPFHSHKTWIAGHRVSILGKTGLPGVMVPQLKKINLTTGQAILEYEFIGNKDSAAKYITPIFLDIYEAIKGKTYKRPSELPSEMRNNMEAEYTINLEGWPIKKIYLKITEFYIERSVSKTTMIGISRIDSCCNSFENRWNRPAAIHLIILSFFFTAASQ